MHLVDSCHGIYGDLSDSNRAILDRMMHEGSEELWQRARNIIIVPLPIITLSMAVKRVAQDRPYSGSFPDPFTVRRAVHYALHREDLFRENPQAFDIET